MSNPGEQLMALGAESVCSHLWLNRKLVGVFKNDGFAITEEGIRVLQEAAPVMVAEPAETEKPTAPKEPKPRARKAKAEPAAAPSSDLDGLDELLNQQ